MLNIRTSLFSFLLATSLPVFAQSTKQDSLLSVLKATREDSVRVSALLKLYSVYESKNPDSARMYASRALELAQKTKDRKSQALALKYIGNTFYMRDNAEAMGNWEKSLEMYRSIKDSAGESNLMSNMGVVLMNGGDDAKATEYYMGALKIAEKRNDSTRIASLLINMGSIYNRRINTKPLAKENWLRALPIVQALHDKNLIGTLSSNLGEFYLDKMVTDSAIYYYNKSMEAHANTYKVAMPLYGLGHVFDSLKNYPKSLQYHKQADSIARSYKHVRYQVTALLGMADVYMKIGERQNAYDALKKAESLALVEKEKQLLKRIYLALANIYAQKNEFSSAFIYQKLLTALKDSLDSEDAQRLVRDAVYGYELEKKDNENKLLSQKAELADLQVKKQKFAKNALIAGLGLVSLIIFILYREYLNKIKTNKLLDSQKAQIQTLLSNILPDEVAEELQRDGVAKPRFYDSASVLFTDFKSFTKLADQLSPQEVIAELNSCFNGFDDIMAKYGLEKIKTIGDAYMCAGGIPVPDPDHYWKIIEAARDIQAYIHNRNEERLTVGLAPWEIRIGIHVGPIVAGVVGKKKYAYDIWGSTVNIASRMESNGEPGQINISAATYDLIKEKYHCTYRGKIYAKNVGEIDMYFLGDAIKQGEKSELKGTISDSQNSLLDLPPIGNSNHMPALSKYEQIRQSALHRLGALDSGLTYHCFDHTLDVLEQCERIASAEGVEDKSMVFLLKVAALYHDTGFLRTYRNHEEESCNIFMEDAKGFGFTEEEIGTVRRLIMVTQIPQRPSDILERVICDADLDYLGRDDFYSIGDTLRREFIRYNVVKDDAAWEELQMKFLSNHAYHTESSRLLREPGKQAHIRKLQGSV